MGYQRRMGRHGLQSSMGKKTRDGEGTRPAHQVHLAGTQLGKVKSVVAYSGG